MFIYLFCADSAAIDPLGIEAFIEEGAYFDDDPGFYVNFGNHGWNKIEITPATGQPPINIHRLTESQHINPYIQQAISALEEAGRAKKHADLAAFLQHIQQVFLFEIDNESLSDDVWEMLDNLEAWMAHERKGVVYVAGEGFYNADLNPICKC